MDIKGKDILIIGSGVDIKGRRLGAFIDNWRGVVIRCNKKYGNPLDIGKRADMYFTRWQSWVGGITPLERGAEYIIINDCHGITPQELKIITYELGHEYASCGLIAVAWCLHRGARSVSVIGFGYSPASRGFFPKGYERPYSEKQGLAVTRFNLDKNTHYDWVAEDAFLINNGVILL